MYNDDVEIGICAPSEPQEYFFRNGEGDEVIFVHEGSGEVETVFGTLPYRRHDYIVIPRSTTYRFRPEGEQLWLTFHTPGEIETPKRYRNRYGQLLQHAPYSHRDFHPPVKLATHRERGEFDLVIRARRGYQHYRLDYHPLDVVGWDGYVYPYTFNIEDFEPITGRVHQPPTVHQTFEGHELRHLLVLPEDARLAGRSDSDPVQPLEHPVRGDDLLRLRGLRLAQGSRNRLDHAASVRPPARPAAGPRREVDRREVHERAGGHVRHLQAAATDAAGG